MNAIVQTEQPRRSLVDSMAARYDMEPKAFVDAIKATVVKGQVSNEQFAAFLMVAKEYDLNPLLKEIYAFPSNGGIQPIVSIDGWMKLINSHPQFDGMEFNDMTDADGKLTAVECRMYRKDRKRPICVIEYMAECFRQTPTWKQWPSRMLRHKAAIQAARYAFGFSEIMEPDEFERMKDVTPRDVTPLSERLAAARQDAGGAREGFDPAHVARETETRSTARENTIEDTASDQSSTETVTDAHDAATEENDTEMTSDVSSSTESADPSSTANNEGGGESSSASPSSASSEINKEWLVTVFKTLRAAVGPDPQVVENQAIALAASAKLQNEATRKKAGTIKASLKRVCEGAELGDEIEYCAGVIGVDPKELAGGAS